MLCYFREWSIQLYIYLILYLCEKLFLIFEVNMEDIFHWCREGNAMQVRVWLDDTEHDMNQG